MLKVRRRRKKRSKIFFNKIFSFIDSEVLSYLTKSLVRLSTNHIEIISNEIIQLRHLLGNTSLNNDVRVRKEIHSFSKFLNFLLQYNLLALFVLSHSNDINEIHDYIKDLSLWKCFLLARWCIRHCLYKLSIELLQNLLPNIQRSIHISWIETLISICQGEERLQTIMNTSKNNLEILCENLAEAGSFYESSLIQMPVR